MRYARAGAAGVIALAVSVGPLALAQGSPPQGPASAAPPAPTHPGVGVLARPGAEAAGWALAKEIYASASLRPAALDEVRARVLVGDAPAADAPRGTRDLADERAAVRGDDGASRALLASIASQIGVTALLIVEPGPSSAPTARLFFVDTQSFDAARYAPDPDPAAPSIADAGAGTTNPAAVASDGSAMDAALDGQAIPLAQGSAPTFRWSGAVQSVERVMTAPPLLRAPSLATSPMPAPKPKEPESHPFYTSPWFWGAVGAAAFGGTAVWFATRDNSPSTIHLDLQVPK